MSKMAVSKFFFSSLKNRSSSFLNSAKRSGHSKKFHSSSCLRSERLNSRLVPDPTQNFESKSNFYIIPAAIAAGFGSAAILFLANDERRAIPKGSEEGRKKSDNSSIKGPKIGGPFSLFDTAGHKITEKDLTGKWVLLYFGYTSSPDVGPAEIHKMAKAIDMLESRDSLQILPVFVTFDPQRDTPSHLSAYLKEFDPRIIGLTGPVQAIRQIAQEYRVFFKKVEEDGDDYLVESSHNMYLMNPNSEIARCFGVEYNAEEMAKSVLEQINKSTA